MSCFETRKKPVPFSRPILEHSLHQAGKDNAIGNVVQRKIKIGNKNYSFQNLYDLNGNPYVKEAGEDNYLSFEKKVPPEAFRTKKKTEEDTFEEFSDTTWKKIKQNFDYGRPMNLANETGDVKSFAHPYKSYNFGHNSAYDIAAYNPNETGPGLKYDQIIKKSLIAAKAVKGGVYSMTAFEEAVKEVVRILPAEEYRQPGAKKITYSIFEAQRESLGNAIESYNKSKATNKEPKKIQDKYESCLEAITTKLPFAGEGGKKKFREEVASNEHASTLGTFDTAYSTKGQAFGFDSPPR